MNENSNSNTAGLQISDEMAHVFEAASERRLTLTCDTHDEAEAFRFKLHHVRKQMRRLGHPLLAKAERVVFKVEDNQLVASPSRDAKFRDVISQALNQEKKASAKQSNRRSR